MQKKPKEKPKWKTISCKCVVCKKCYRLVIDGKISQYCMYGGPFSEYSEESK